MPTLYSLLCIPQGRCPMSARTPGPKDILGNVIAHDCITFRLQGRDIPLQMLQSARDEAENYREKTITLTAQVAALAAALRDTVRIVEHTVLHGNIFGFDGGAVQDIATKARAALAKDGAR